MLKTHFLSLTAELNKLECFSLEFFQDVQIYFQAMLEPAFSEEPYAPPK
jgi:hypothetical protein